ncbi:MAG: 50S ribosomal protein L4 [Thermoleophilia bacterium]
MPALPKINEEGAVVGEAQLADGLVENEFNTGLVHEVVRAELAAARQGTHSAKSRSEVQATGSKPWRQKGTGRARAGSASSPIWTKGGVAFPPIPRSYAFKVNRKVRAKAFRQALGNLVQTESVRVLSDVNFDAPSTKRAANIVAEAGLTSPLLVIGGRGEDELMLSFRNLPETRVLPVDEVEVQDYVWARQVLITESALAAVAGGEE